MEADADEEDSVEAAVGVAAEDAGEVVAQVVAEAADLLLLLASRERERSQCEELIHS